MVYVIKNITDYAIEYIDKNLILNYNIMELKLEKRQTYDSFTIDGKELSELSHDALRMQLIEIANRLRKEQLFDMLYGLVETYGNFVGFGNGDDSFFEIYELKI